MTVVPWKCGKRLMWDATCPDTFARSFSSHATLAVGEVAALAEKRKCTKGGKSVRTSTTQNYHCFLCAQQLKSSV